MEPTRPRSCDHVPAARGSFGMLDSRNESRAGQRSSGVKPVRLAILANIFGPISSSSWNENTKSAQFVRFNVRCEPDCRFSCQPIFKRAASARRAFVDGQLLKQPET